MHDDRTETRFIVWFYGALGLITVIAMGVVLALSAEAAFMLIVVPLLLCIGILGAAMREHHGHG